MKIDPEFNSLLGNLSAEEEKLLRESIKQDGVREPLTVWVQDWTCPNCKCRDLPESESWEIAYFCPKCEQEIDQDSVVKIYNNGILVDGHNRLRIANELREAYRVRFVRFADRDEAKRWIAKNQLARRNLSAAKREYCLGLLYNKEKQDSVGRPNKFDQNGQIISGATAEKLAEAHGVGRTTVTRAGQYADAVDTLDSAIPGTREKALGGFVPRQQVMAAAKQVSEGDINKAKATLASGKKSLREKLSDEMMESKQKKLAVLPPRERARLLLETCTLSAALRVLVELTPSADRLREVTEGIKYLKEVSINLQRRKP